MDARIPTFDRGADATELRRAFQRAGIVVVRGAVDSAALERLRAAAAEVLAVVAKRPALALGLDDAGRFNRVPFVLALDPDAKPLSALVRSPFVGALAETLLGAGAVCTGDVLVVKAAGPASQFPVHVDCEPVAPARLGRRWFVNVGVYLDDAGADNGCVAVLPGSHADPNAWAAVPRRRDRFDDLVPVEAEAGDVVVHHCALVHGSAASVQASPRRTLYFEFHPFLPALLYAEARLELPMARSEILARRRLHQEVRHA
ncbi:MAG TPA: phytanoyl-CoA dioxygenase family protein [Polyangia bacterium]|nr:phytanoyl-CoA dioxygenase family protein [Polyangia bacterium]